MRWTNAADFHLDDNTQRALLYRVTGGYLACSILDLIGPSANESNVLSQVVPEEFRSAGQEDAAAAAARKPAMYTETGLIAASAGLTINRRGRRTVAV